MKEFESGSAIYQLCVLHKVLDLSEPQLLHLLYLQNDL